VDVASREGDLDRKGAGELAPELFIHAIFLLPLIF
jgi:hypothetical protein